MSSTHLLYFSVPTPGGENHELVCLLVTEHEPGKMTAMIGSGSPAFGLAGTELPGEFNSLRAMEKAATELVVTWRDSFAHLRRDISQRSLEESGGGS